MMQGSKSDLRLCGYKLGDDILFYLQDNVLINFSKNNFSRVQFRTTMANLLLYLLSYSDGNYITDDEIMANVWEKNNLQASSHRLWQVSRDLRLKLHEVGLRSELFYRVERRGFSVNNTLVMPIYCDDNSPKPRILSVPSRELSRA
ncbi:CadC family transcriptional regulator [Serratia fonticola]|uniref:CadC family transcriptional regulator n=1 Tax=Serratia fonticola TaxID=47917 RepID=UPI002097C004|nr:CadC family transcriptional regulator [Serratia fonticola]MCO7508683.1 CadC family transcriptional regulator [Serratia fonticola]MDK2376507.1 CadC family transcriptional regulator [Serratia fonticola]